MCSYARSWPTPTRSTSWRPGLVLHHLAEQVAERLLTQGPHPLRRELVATLALVDEPGFLEDLRQLLEPFERARRVLAEQVARLVDVDLGELAGLGRVLQHVLELVEVAERLEQPGHLPELHRVVAAEVLPLVPRHVRERLLEVARQLVDLPAQVHVLEQRLREPLELRALLGRHRVEHLLHRAIERAICSSSSSRVCGFSGKKSP